MFDDVTEHRLHALPHTLKREVLKCKIEGLSPKIFLTLSVYTCMCVFNWGGGLITGGHQRNYCELLRLKTLAFIPS